MQLTRTLIALAALVPFALAIPTGGGGSTPPTPAPIPPSQCNTGPIQCCNEVQAADAPAVTALFGLLGIVLQDVNVLVGLTCSPISVIGLPGNSWLV